MPAYAHRMDGITGSAIRELFKLLAKGDIISFGGGNPSASSFPVEDVRRITDDLLTSLSISSPLHSPHTNRPPSGLVKLHSSGK